MDGLHRAQRRYVPACSGENSLPIESQGFTNIADFSKNGGDPYFVKDTIHLGWLGWLAFDKAVDPFLSNPTPAPTYHLNERFFSKDWATYDGDVKTFK